MNLTVTSKGRQFDRLGLMFLGDIEVFRTSTAEPTTDGIVWTYVKEMSLYNTLWKNEQKIIFDLGNLVNDVYTGTFNTTLTATFFTVPDSLATSDIILPISAKKSAANQGSAFSLPSQVASVAYELPRNIKKAVVSLSACGQAAEEFWYTNVLSSEVDTFATTTGSLSGYSSFREIQLWVDDQLAGVSWPFPVIFTGGISPGLWRPIAGIDTFDLREHEIDITPWLPLLCDGTSHNFEIRVVGLDDDGQGHATVSQNVGSNWVVTGKIFLFLDVDGTTTTGSSFRINAPPPQLSISSSITTNSTGSNETLKCITRAVRDIFISSTINNSSGSHNVYWHQHLSYSSSSTYSSQGLTQFVDQSTDGSDKSSSGYLNSYNFPLTVNSSFFTTEARSIGISASISRGLTYNIFGPSVFPSGIQAINILSPSILSIPGRLAPDYIRLPTRLPKMSGALLTTIQSGNATFFRSTTRAYSYGTTEQDFSFRGVEAGPQRVTYEIYKRHVVAVNSTVRADSQTLVGQTLDVLPAEQPKSVSPLSLVIALEGFSVRSILGRGPGKTKAELAGEHVLDARGRE